MNEKQLRYALAVRREASFSAAGEALLISQPALSEQVRLLEEELGFALFERTPRGVRVTEMGTLFLRQAEGVIDSFKGLIDLARYLRKLPEETVSIGLSPWMTLSFLPACISSLQKGMPGFRLSCISAMASELQRMVLQETVEFAVFIQAVPRVESPSLICETLERRAVSVNPTFPLALIS